MAGKTVLTLGGGWGGMALAYGLRGMLEAEHRVVVIEKKETFSLCLSNLKIMTGAWKSPAEAERQMSRMARDGIEWVHEEARTIDPRAREVHTESQTLRGDYLVIALGPASILTACRVSQSQPTTCMKPPERTRFSRPSQSSTAGRSPYWSPACLTVVPRPPMRPRS